MPTLPAALGRGALALAVALAAAPAAASADSIVFVRDHNVWLANPDGSGQHQVTLDGTADNPYQSPSQADDGTIVTVRQQPNNGPILRLRQNGSVIGQIRVPVAQNGPFEPAISPDGRIVAYETAASSTMGHQAEVHYADADGVTAPGTYPFGGAGTSSPSWIDARRVLLGNYTQVSTQVPGQQPVPWWSDWDHQPTWFGFSEALADGEAAPDGTIAFVRGDRDGNTIQLYRSNGPAALPTPTCVLSDPSPGPLGQRFSDPTLSPSGDALAWQEGDGIWTTRLVPGDCAASAPRLLIPGASEPDWGPAPVDPGPRETPRVDPPSAEPPRTAALARCDAGPRRRRAACVRRAKRAAAIRACQRKAAAGRARARCVAKAKRRFR